MKVKSKVLILGVIFCMLFSLTGMAAAATDISGHWARETIEQCLSDGIVAGMPDGSFQPNKNVTRAEFATMVNKAFGFKDAGTGKVFSDVKAGAWYADQVAIAAKAGYITGFPDGTFQPQKQCTRAEACVMIRKAAGMAEGPESALSVFKDSGSIPAFAKSSVSALVSENLIKGYPDGTFGPQAQVTRAESLVMVYRTSTGDLKVDEKVNVTGVELDKTNITVSVDSTTRLKATVKPANATNKKVEWTTSDKGIATVDDDGLVKGIKVGEATITVTTKDGEKTATCKVNVTRRSAASGGGGGPVDVKGSLKAKIAVVKAFNAADYTAASWAVLQTALAEAERITADPNATQAEINKALADLNAAQAALVKVPSEVIPAVESFQTATSLVIGKTKVIVGLDTATPENYTVTVGGVELSYNADAKKFIGDVITSQAEEDNVVVTQRGGVAPDPDPELPAVESFQTATSLVIGKTKVIVGLDTATPENYTVTVGGVELSYNADAKKFIGDVITSQAEEDNVVVTQRGGVAPDPDPELPAVESFQTATSLVIGKTKVIVGLDTATPENYTVTVGGVELSYNADAKKFIGDVITSQADEDNVVVTVK